MFHQRYFFNFLGTLLYTQKENCVSDWSTSAQIECNMEVEVKITGLIIYTKKLLNSDWLRKECSSSVTRVQNV